jgi:hypothetical protein
MSDYLDYLLGVLSELREKEALAGKLAEDARANEKEIKRLRGTLTERVKAGDTTGDEVYDLMLRHFRGDMTQYAAYTRLLADLNANRGRLVMVAYNKQDNEGTRENPRYGQPYQVRVFGIVQSAPVKIGDLFNKHGFLVISTMRSFSRLMMNPLVACQFGLSTRPIKMLNVVYFSGKKEDSLPGYYVWSYDSEMEEFRRGTIEFADAPGVMDKVRSDIGSDYDKFIQGDAK